MKALRKEGIRMVLDERILGESDLVAEALRSAEEKLERKTRLKREGLHPRTTAERVATLVDIHVEEILQPGKSPRRQRTQTVFCYWAVSELDHTASSIVLFLGLTQPAIRKRDLHLET